MGQDWKGACRARRENICMPRFFINHNTCSLPQGMVPSWDLPLCDNLLSLGELALGDQ